MRFFNLFFLLFHGRNPPPSKNFFFLLPDLETNNTDLKKTTVFDTPADVPEDIAGNKRYAAAAGKGFTVSECASNLEKALGGKKIDVLVHSLANGPEVAKPLLETSRNGYLAAVSASSYSYVSMLQRFGPLMNKGTPFFFFFFVWGSFGGKKKHSLFSVLLLPPTKKQAAPRSR